MKKINMILLAAAALAFSAGACNGGGGGDEDTGTDPVQDPVQDEAVTDPAAEDLPADPVPDEVVPDDTPDVPVDTPVDTPEEELGPGTCGNGTVESGEICDDGNTLTENCGTEGCLADCSMNIATCGNGTVDPGEACDGGADCTESCNVNDYGIGAPCTCTSGCNDRDFSAGNIEGCNNVTVPSGTGGVPVCMRSIHDSTADYSTYYAGGMCTIIALECTGGAFCYLVAQFGDLDTFACPEGYIVHEDSRDIMGVTIHSKMCMKTCTSSADCRWNDQDEFWEECGLWDCVPYPGDPTQKICHDLRME